MNHIGCRKEIKFVKSLWAGRGHVVKIWRKETGQWKKRCFSSLVSRHCGTVSSLMVRVHLRYRAHTGAHLPVMWRVSSTQEIKRSSTGWLICPIASYASINAVTLNSTRHTHGALPCLTSAGTFEKYGTMNFRVKKKKMHNEEHDCNNCSLVYYYFSFFLFFNFLFFFGLGW